MIIKKDNFINEFLKDNDNVKSSNLYIIKDSNNNIMHMYNYNTVIASKKINDKKIYLNKKKYSMTTTRNTNLIKRIAEKNNYSIIEYQKNTSLEVAFYI